MFRLDFLDLNDLFQNVISRIKELRITCKDLIGIYVADELYVSLPASIALTALCPIQQPYQ